MTGPERRDESVQFSLKELMKLEDERVDGEKREREARDRREREAREEAARRERAELEARERREAEAREQARRAELEEEARREAMSRAAVEQARIGVEARARAEEAERERRHEVELLRLRQDSRPKPGAGLVVGAALGGAALASLLGVVVHFAALGPAAERRVAEAALQAAAETSRANELDRRVAEQSARLESMKGELEVAKSDLAKLHAAATPVKAPAGPGGPGGVHPPVTRGDKLPKTPDEKPCLDEHDPLCGTIRRR